MGLAPGTRLGPYEIVGAIGSGGMGEVYRARDARLGRDVAVKVLPPDVTDDASRLSRFEQEARATAALNHPNILAIYDVGHDDGSASSVAGRPPGPRVAYIVTELLEGQTLRDLLRNERPAVSRVVDLAAQVADGLAAAHSRGIVHRDVKPENIFVTTEGRAKVLDFGLAKPVASNAAAIEAATRSSTAPHTVLGTAGYMSPEQVRGEPLDHRSDIFAFGVVLYEMLTGQRAFKGQNALDVITAILREAPVPVSSIADRPIPPALVRLVDRCLEKAPTARFQSTTDLAFALRTMAQSETSVTAAVAATVALPRITQSTRNPTAARVLIPWVLFAAASLGLVAMTTMRWLEPEPPPPAAIRFTVPPPEDGFIGVGGGVAMAVSPDGQQIVFGATIGAEARPSLWLRDLRSAESRSLPAARSVSANPNVFWSPDSREVGFWDQGQLKRVILESGVVSVIAATQPLSGPTWGPDGTIVFGSQSGAQSMEGGLYRVAASGGSPTQITTPDAGRGELTHARPNFLPDGRHFLFLAMPGKLRAGSLDSPEVKEILDVNSQAVYSLGYLLFVRQSTLLAQRFDPDRLEVTGESIAVAEDVRTSPTTGVAQFSVSKNGVLVYQTGDVSRTAPLVWLDRSGRTLSTVPDSTANYLAVALAPDARQAIVSLRGGRIADLWALDIERGTRLRLTSGTRFNTRPFVSPDGARIVWSADSPKEPLGLFVKRADGVGPEETVISATAGGQVTDWSSQTLVFVRNSTGGRSSIWVAPAADPSKPTLYLEEPFGLREGRLSPDGHWMAYISNETGSDAIYIRPFPTASGGKWPVSAVEGGMLHWRDDGRELVFLARGRKMMAVPIKFGPRGAEPGTPVELFTAPSRYGDVSRDHSRFLMMSPPIDSVRRTPLTVVVNWTSLLVNK